MVFGLVFVSLFCRRIWLCGILMIAILVLSRESSCGFGQPCCDLFFFWGLLLPGLINSEVSVDWGQLVLGLFTERSCDCH